MNIEELRQELAMTYHSDGWIAEASMIQIRSALPALLREREALLRVREAAEGCRRGDYFAQLAAGFRLDAALASYKEVEK